MLSITETLDVNSYLIDNKEIQLLSWISKYIHRGIPIKQSFLKAAYHFVDPGENNPELNRKYLIEYIRNLCNDFDTWDFFGKKTYKDQSWLFNEIMKKFNLYFKQSSELRTYIRTTVLPAITN